ncbi:L-serine ammonia-lyase, iron-sulfur-dependent, subunit alpha [Lachnospiraceae bacterium YH-ros2228]
MYDSIEEIIRIAEEKKRAFWEIVLEEDAGAQDISEEEDKKRMLSTYQAMVESDRSYDPNLSSTSGLVGREAKKIADRRAKKEMICGDLIAAVMERALRVAESNACMKKIVAAPTAGSCGVMPAVLLTLQEKYGYSDEKMAEALFVAGGIGGVIASRASLSGAEGGCQAEIGAASAMTAGAAVYLQGGSDRQIANAAALALKSLLGLSCDPVAGLVEVPCVKRNVIGAVNALTACDMTLAGIESKIPPDEVFDAMGSIGRNMDESIRETGTGGLAGTPTGRKIRSMMRGME